MPLYQPYALKLDTVELSGTPVILGGITQQAIQLNPETSREITAGSPDPYFASLDKLMPGATLTTYAVAAALDTIGLRGLKITNDAVGPPVTTGVVFYLAQIDPDTGQALSGANHLSRTFRSGLLYPTRLTVDNQGQASLGLALAGRWDGTNDTVTPASGVSLPTFPNDDERFALGSSTIAGVTVTRKTQLEIDFGLQVQQLTTDGDTQPAFLHLEQALPRVSVRGLNPDDFAAANIPLSGKEATHANTTFRLRKRTENAAGFSSSADNIDLTFHGLTYWETVHEGQGNQRSQTVLIIEPTHDNTNLPVTVDTAAS